jgi:hypothetical protein
MTALDRNVPLPAAALCGTSSSRLCFTEDLPADVTEGNDGRCLLGMW